MKKKTEFFRRGHARIILILRIIKFTADECKCDDHDRSQDRSINCSSRGTVLFPFCSLINHSCVENVEILMVEKQKIVFMAKQRIYKDEQVKYFCYIFYLQTYCYYYILRAESIKVKIWKLEY